MGCTQPKASFEEDETIPNVVMEEVTGEEITFRDVLAPIVKMVLSFWVLEETV